MGYAVYHVEKGKSNANAIGHHIDRTEGKEHSYRQADPDRKDQNLHFRGLHNGAEKKDLQTAVDDRIKEGYTGKRAIRKDAVKYLKHVTTGSHEDMTEMVKKDPEKFKKWVRANVEFMKEEFGKENIVRCSVHMDEKTPHMHFVTVPLTEDGRLSAKSVLGDRKEMSARQDRYAEKMSEFGLKRGLKRTGIKHEDAKQYYARIKKHEETRKTGISQIKANQISPPVTFPVSVKLEKPSVMDVASDKRWDKYQKGVSEKLGKTFNKELNEAKTKMAKDFNGQMERFLEDNDENSVIGAKLTKENRKLRAKVLDLDKELNPEKYIKKGKGKGLGLGRSLNPFD